MTAESKIVRLNPVIRSNESEQIAPDQVTIYRFDLFKGVEEEQGKVTKVKSVGSVYLRDGLKTYTVHLKTFLKDTFYLLPNTKEGSFADFVILTREDAKTSGRKYFWNNVGHGVLLTGENHGILKLSWDLLTDGIYMSIHPIQESKVYSTPREDSAA